MKIGLLGIDDRVLRLAQAAQARGHEIVCCYLDGPLDAAQSAALGPLPRVAGWDQLLVAPGLEAAIVAQAPDSVDAEAARVVPLRTMAQSGLPVLVSHPVVLSTISYYELDMACEESHAVLLPYSPWPWHPALAKLQSLFSASALGSVKQVALEHCVADDRRETLTRAFAEDLDLMRLLAGEIARLQAMTTLIPVGDILSAANNPAKDPHWPGLNVQFVGAGGIAGRWTPHVTAAGERAEFTLNVTCERGTAQFVPGADSAIILTWTTAGTTRSETFPADLAAEEAALADWEQAINRTAPPRVTWADACHGIHAAESISRSLKRGRVIDLNYDDYSEEGTFKGLMAAGGCLVLLAALAILTVGGMLGKFGFNRIDRMVPMVLLVLLVGFLALQFLGAVFKSDPKRDSAPPPGP